MPKASEQVIQAVATTLAEVAPPGDAVLLVAVSGGVDSMVLWHALATFGTGTVIACHLNHGLRAAAKEEAALVRQRAKTIGCRCVAARADVGKEARRLGVSVQEAGRRARRAFFARQAQRFGARLLFLAHHADDQAETVLWNLVRGSSPRGVAGIAPDAFQDFDGLTLRVLRPLLNLRKSTLVEAAREADIPWLEDQSNTQTTYTRNCIRLQAIPALRESTGRDPVPTLARFAALARDDEEWLAQIADDAATHVGTPCGGITLAGLRQLPRPLARRVIESWLRTYGCRDLDCHSTLRALAVALADNKPRAVNLAGGMRVSRRRGVLVCLAAPPTPTKRISRNSVTGE